VKDSPLAISEIDKTIASLLKQQEVLATFGELALRAESLDEILLEACRLVSEALGTDLAKVMELREDGMTLLVRAGVGWKSGVVGRVTVKAVKGSSEGYALLTGEPVISHDISTEHRFEYADFIKDDGVRAIVSVIILGAEKKPPFGILQVDSRHPRHFTDQDTRFLKGYANLIGAAVDRLCESERVRRMATHDPLTSLPNRTEFQRSLELALHHAQNAGKDVSLLLVDLDGLKQINDFRGHQTGDATLCGFSKRFNEALPDGGMLARLSGDEFGAILPDTSAAAADRQAKVMLDHLRLPFSVEGRNIDLRASVGISTFPAGGKSARQLLESADLALYSAKKEGGNRALSYSPAMRSEKQGQAAMLRHARSALKHEWILPFYQPQVSLDTGRLRGFEALLRWHHPRIGLQHPASIACAFDDPSTATAIGEVIMDAALSHLKRWLDDSIVIDKLSINVSPAEFRRVSYCKRLLDRLQVMGIDPSFLEIEITESAFLGSNLKDVVRLLEELRSAGVTVALDDFGTGYSSLSHLRNLPVDTIKIDRAFVDGIDKSPRDRSIVEAVLMLGDALSMTTIAEGVETITQATFLKARGCTFAQGFLIAPALDSMQAEARLKRASDGITSTPDHGMNLETMLSRFG
jgi:diguanylate cyclase (GGDEF)-like protein